MANGRNKTRKGDAGRDSGGFVALPWSVLDCPAYAELSHPARSLLWEFARQYVRDNNGRLLASGAYLRTRGWTSKDVITRAVRELVATGFIFQTAMGHRPNKASWYAVTWRALDKLPGYDVGMVEGFSRGAYQKGNPVIGVPPGPSGGVEENATLRPSHGVEGTPIGPSGGVERTAPRPSRGPIEVTFGTSPRPFHGHHLEKPSTGVCIAASESKVLGAVATADNARTGARALTESKLHSTGEVGLADQSQNESSAGEVCTQPARRKRKEVKPWIQFELMA